MKYSVVNQKIKQDILKIVEDLADNSFAFSELLSMELDTILDIAEWDMEDLIRDTENDLNYMGVQSSTGASRMVLFLDEYPNFVVKIDIGIDDGEDFLTQKELEIYKQIKNSKFKKFFTPIMEIGEVYGRKIYIMERLEVDESTVTECSDNYLSSIKFTREEEKFTYLTSKIGYYIDTSVIASLLYSGVTHEEVRRLELLCEQLCINDIVPRNIGYDTITKTFKLIDYAGYWY